MDARQLIEIHNALKEAGCQCHLKGAFISADGITATCPECGVSVNIPPSAPQSAPQSTVTYQLTPEEAAAVEAIRAHRAAEESSRRITQHLLDTAAAYHRWLHASGRGSTFSAFCDDYNYQPPDPEMSRKPIYDVVVGLIAAARDAAEKMVAGLEAARLTPHTPDRADARDGEDESSTRAAGERWQHVYSSAVCRKLHPRGG